MIAGLAWIAGQPAQAQEGSERFAVADLINGRLANEDICASTSTAVWVTSVPGGPACVRYYYSEVGGIKPNALVFLPDNQLIASADGRVAPIPGYDAGSPQSLIARAADWSRATRGPALMLARPGSYGSSGNERAESGTKREAELVNAALDTIRERHRLTGFHVAGLAVGGNLAATLTAFRTDVACSVSVAAALSEVDRQASGQATPETRSRASLSDPIAELAVLKPRLDLRMWAITVQGDRETPDAALAAYVARARDAGIVVARVTLPAGVSRVDQSLRALQAATLCALGETNPRIEAALAAPLPAAGSTPQPSATPPVARQPVAAPQPQAKIPVAVTPQVPAAPVTPQQQQPATPPQQQQAPVTPPTPQQAVVPPTTTVPARRNLGPPVFTAPAPTQNQTPQTRTPTPQTQPPVAPVPQTQTQTQPTVAPVPQAQTPPVAPVPQTQNQNQTQTQPRSAPTTPPRNVGPQPQPQPQPQNAVPVDPPPQQRRTDVSPRQLAPVAAVSPEKFSRVDVLRGTMTDEATCKATANAVWAVDAGKGECIRYYFSDAGGAGTRALLFMNGDFTYRGNDGNPTVDAEYDNVGPGDLQHIAEVRSRDYGGPMIYLARPGTFGSSGNELRLRHTPREVALVGAAIDEIKRRLGLQTFDMVGHSGGGLLLGGFIAQRSDIACAVSSSGVLATNQWVAERLNIPPPNDGQLYDPLQRVADIKPGPDFRLFVLTDAQDIRVPPTSTQLYLKALEQRGIGFQHLKLTASDDAHHDLALHAFRAAIACAHGAQDVAVAELLTKTQVTNKRMSEMGAIGDMPKLTASGTGNGNAKQPATRPPPPTVQPRQPDRTTNDDATPRSESAGAKNGQSRGTRTVQPPVPDTLPQTAQPQPTQPQQTQPQTTQPQTAQPQPVPRSPAPQPNPSVPRQPTDSFRIRDVLSGVPVSPGDCGRTGTAVLVVVDNLPECIVYYLSTKGGNVGDPVVFLPWDQVMTVGSQRPTVRGGYEDVTPEGLAQLADDFSQRFKRPFMFLARPGTYASSGNAVELQHTQREVDLVMAALDAIRRRQGYDKLNLVGPGGGGLLVAAATQRRTDIGCAVIANGFLSVRDGYRMNIYGPSSKDPALLYDPIAQIAASRQTPPSRLIVLQDPLDTVSPHALQDDFIAAIKAAGLPVLALRATGLLPDHHDIGAFAMRAMLACVQNSNDQAITEFVARTATSPQAPPPAPMPKDMAQDVVPTMPTTTEAHFSAAELVNGTRADRVQCTTTPNAVWLVVEGRGDCLRYYYSEVGGRKPSAFVFMNGDMVVSSGPNDMLAARPGYEEEKPSDLQKIADTWSQVYRGPAIYLARPGTFGSSGREIVDRRTNREVALVSGALDEIRRRHNVQSFDIVGQSGGGHLVLAMVTKRDDIRCATSASGVLSVRGLEEAFGRRHRESDYARIYDPLLHIAEIVDRPERRIFILTDPMDKVVIPKTTETYLAALRDRGIPAQHYEGQAKDPDHHGLALHGIRATLACSFGQTDTAIAKVIADTVVTMPMMAEMGPMGVMDHPK